MEQTETNLKIPQHVAIIMDGNRRWAKKQGLSFFQGHKQAAEKTLPELIESSGKLGIKYFTFWALSTENLEKRTKNEVEKLLSLMRFFLKKKLNEFKKKGVKLMTIGDLKKLPLDIQDLITKGKKETQKNKKIHVIFAINYGGRNEIVRAIQKIRNPFTVNPFRMNPKQYQNSYDKNSKHFDHSDFENSNLFRASNFDIRNYVAYYLPRKNFFLNRFLTKGGQYPDYTIRLYRNGFARFPCKDVHENVEIINPKSKIQISNQIQNLNVKGVFGL